MLPWFREWIWHSSHLKYTHPLVVALCVARPWACCSLHIKT